MKWRDAILSEAEVLKIRKLVEIGISQVDIARRFGKSLNTINRVVKNTRPICHDTELSEIETAGHCGVRPPAKRGRPRIEDRAKTTEAKKPWLKLGMSRRTWYRHQAEKRAKGRA